MLPPETERKLVERAARYGQNVETCACELIERGVNAEPTLDEILAPFRRQGGFPINQAALQGSDACPRMILCSRRPSTGSFSPLRWTVRPCPPVIIGLQFLLACRAELALLPSGATFPDTLPWKDTWQGSAGVLRTLHHA
jgi:hypothetical protein